MQAKKRKTEIVNNVGGHFDVKKSRDWNKQKNMLFRFNKMESFGKHSKRVVSGKNYRVKQEFRKW